MSYDQSCANERDDAWWDEHRRETVRAVAITEERALAANIMALMVMIFATRALPYADAFTVPLLLRAAAIGSTRLAWNRLRRETDALRDYRPAVRLVAATLFLGGASWALLLYPLIQNPSPTAARFIVGGGTMIAVGFIITMTAPITIAAASFLAGFLLFFFAALTVVPADSVVLTAIGMLGLMAAIASYAFAAMKQKHHAIEMLLDNRRMSEELAEALEHARFLSERDPLTGLYNRRFLFERAFKDNGLRAHGHFLLIDLDHFKSLNDRHGHETGDRVLIEVGRVLRDISRREAGETGFAVRLGGEEFALYLEEGESYAAFDVAETIRARIETIARELDLPNGCTSASLGLSRFRRADTIDEALHRADTAMYQAKNGGRNRVWRAAA